MAYNSSEDSNYLKEIAKAKLNLNFKVFKKMPNDYHEIESIIVFLPQIYDTLYVRKSNENSLHIIGKEAENLLKKGGDTLIKKSINYLSDLLKINIKLDIQLNKTIPLGSGLGGGSADAAAIIRAILKIYNIKKKKNLIFSLLSQLGSDVTVCYHSKNSHVFGTGDIIKPIAKFKRKIWVLLIKPYIHSDTGKIFKKFSGPYSNKKNFHIDLFNVLQDMNNYKNALEATVCKAYSGVNKLLNLLPDNNNITRPRITGTGSTVFVLFNSKKDLKNYMESINKIIKNYWHRETYILM